MQLIAGRPDETTRSYCENSVGTGNWRPEVGVVVLRNVTLYEKRRFSFAKGKRRKWVDGQRDRAGLNYGVKCHWFPYHWVTNAAIVLSPLKELSYTEFSGLLPGRSHDNIKNQWNVLKTIFHREVKRSVELADAAYSSQLKYFKSLMFIKGSDYVDSSISTLDPKEKLWETSKEN